LAAAGIVVGSKGGTRHWLEWDLTAWKDDAWADHADRDEQ